MTYQINCVNCTKLIIYKDKQNDHKNTAKLCKKCRVKFDPKLILGLTNYTNSKKDTKVFPGSKIRNFILIKRLPNTKNKLAFWLMKCLVCGKNSSRYLNAIRYGKSFSCGCKKLKHGSDKHYSGQQFHYLTLTKRVPSPKNKRGQFWETKCRCGTIKILDTRFLRNKKIQSCGCFARELARKRRGKNSPNYNPNLSDQDRLDRKREYTFELFQWRKSIFKRDNYTCICCRQKGKVLNAHHIQSYTKFPALRTEINNGITLCKNCHKSFHKQYGVKTFTSQNLYEFIKNNNSSPFGCDVLDKCLNGLEQIKMAVIRN